MKKKLLIIGAISIFIIAVLGGCACSPESKFVGEWVGKADAEKVYGTPQSDIEKKLFGIWRSDAEANSIDEYKYIRIYRDKNGTVKCITLGMVADVLELVDENGTVLIPGEKSSVDKVVYDSSNDTITYEDKYRKAVYKKTDVLSNLTLNSDHTGVIVDKSYKAMDHYDILSDDETHQLTWKQSANNNPNCIVVDISGVTDNLTYDAEKDIMTIEGYPGYYYERVSK